MNEDFCNRILFIAQGECANPPYVLRTCVCVRVFVCGCVGVYVSACVRSRLVSTLELQLESFTTNITFVDIGLKLRVLMSH